MQPGKMMNRIGARQLALRGAFLTGLLALGLVLGITQGVRAQDNPNDLAGVWRTQVTFTNCATGLPVGVPTFPAVNTFFEEGVVQETGSRSMLRTPGHGTWSRVSHDVFQSQLMWFRFDAAGNGIGTQDVQRTIRLVGEDQYTAEAQVVMRDNNGNQVGAGCATETGTRSE